MEKGLGNKPRFMCRPLHKSPPLLALTRHHKHGWINYIWLCKSWCILRVIKIAWSSFSWQGVFKVWNSFTTLKMILKYSFFLSCIKILYTFFDFGLWHHLCIGYPHCFPLFLQVPQFDLVRSHQHGLLALGLP